MVPYGFDAVKSRMARYEFVNRLTGEVHAADETTEDRAMRTYDRLRLGEHHEQALQAAWNTHGEAAFIIRVIETQQDRDRQAALDAKRAAKGK